MLVAVLHAGLVGGRVGGAITLLIMVAYAAFGRFVAGSVTSEQFWIYSVANLIATVLAVVYGERGK